MLIVYIIIGTVFNRKLSIFRRISKKTCCLRSHIYDVCGCTVVWKKMFVIKKYEMLLFLCVRIICTQCYGRQASYFLSLVCHFTMLNNMKVNKIFFQICDFLGGFFFNFCNYIVFLYTYFVVSGKYGSVHFLTISRYQNIISVRNVLDISNYNFVYIISVCNFRLHIF